MNTFTLGFTDREDFNGFMDEIGFYENEVLQNTLLVEVVGFIYTETGDTYEAEDEFGNTVVYPVCEKSELFYVNVLALNEDAENIISKSGKVVEPMRLNMFDHSASTLETL